MDDQTENGGAAADVQRVLDSGDRGAGRRRRWPWAAAAVVVVAMAALWLSARPGANISYLTEPARRTDLVVTVTATGDLQPTDQVDVGTEISGTIETVGVDYNDQVHAGEVLARLDTDRLQAAVAESEAALASAQAKLEEARATEEESDLRLDRVQHLTQSSLASQEDLTTARASVARARAGIASAKAAITEAGARLSSDRANLDKATIRSPIDGIVLTRKVEPGQTVAASLQTPVLFTLAETLARMELHVAVDEADVGQVQTGQSATFTVAAYPDRQFPATIEAVHFAPTTTAEGVVTYEAVLSVANDDLVLRPGMTATADIVVAKRDDVLVVPNTALRFEPPSTPAARSFRMLPGPPGRTPPRPEGQRSPRVWVLAAGAPKAVPVITGATDGVVTEIVRRCHGGRGRAGGLQPDG